MVANIYRHQVLWETGLPPISMAIQMDNLFLDSEERALVLSKFTAENQLAFAVMLKFFQNEGSYPTQTDVLPEMVAELAIQLSRPT